jgi:hypothetical protein
MYCTSIGFAPSSIQSETAVCRSARACVRLPARFAAFWIDV